MSQNNCLVYGVHRSNTEKRQNALSLQVLDELCKDLNLTCRKYEQDFESIGEKQKNGYWSGG